MYTIISLLFLSFFIAVLAVRRKLCEKHRYREGIYSVVERTDGFPIHGTFMGSGNSMLSANRYILVGDVGCEVFCNLATIAYLPLLPQYNFEVLSEDTESRTWGTSPHTESPGLLSGIGGKYWVSMLGVTAGWALPSLH